MGGFSLSLVEDSSYLYLTNLWAQTTGNGFGEKLFQHIQSFGRPILAYVKTGNEAQKSFLKNGFQKENSLPVELQHLPHSADSEPFQFFPHD